MPPNWKHIIAADNGLCVLPATNLDCYHAHNKAIYWGCKQPVQDNNLQCYQVQSLDMK